MKLVVATQNKGKVLEFRRIFARYQIEVTTPKELGIALDVEETGKTFMENAYIKAKYVSDQTGCMAVADDSGLCIEALPDLLGVYSARFMGEDTDYRIKNARVLELMQKVPKNERCAWFESAVCLVVPNRTETLQCVGRCYGEIGYEASGENGFGYDPIFYVGGKSFAQLSGEEKDSMSHRGKALAEFVEKLAGFLKS